MALEACFVLSDEWKARHPLISPTGVMNLSEPPLADEIFFSVPQDPADGSIWYFPQTYRLDEHEKYLLMSPGRDRAGTIGFRCVVDANNLAAFSYSGS